MEENKYTNEIGILSMEWRHNMEAIIEAEKSDLTKLIDEYKQNHVDDFKPDELVKYVRSSIINTVSINEADIRFFIDEEKINYVTW